MSSIGTELPKEQERVRKLRDLYLELEGGAGKIGAVLMELSLKKAEQAVASGDVIKILQAYEDLKGYKE